MTPGWNSIHPVWISLLGVGLFLNFILWVLAVTGISILCLLGSVFFSILWAAEDWKNATLSPAMIYNGIALINNYFIFRVLPLGPSFLELHYTQIPNFISSLMILNMLNVQLMVVCFGKYFTMLYNSSFCKGSNVINRWNHLKYTKSFHLFRASSYNSTPVTRPGVLLLTHLWYVDKALPSLFHSLHLYKATKLHEGCNLPIINLKCQSTNVNHKFFTGILQKICKRSPGLQMRGVL